MLVTLFAMFSAPSSPPVITRLTSPSTSVIHVAWQPPLFTNGPLAGYRLHLQPLNNSKGVELLKEVSAALSAYTFSSLQDNTLYQVSIAAWNMEGRGPEAKGHVTTRSETGSKYRSLKC